MDVVRVDGREAVLFVESVGLFRRECWCSLFQWLSGAREPSEEDGELVGDEKSYSPWEEGC